MLSSYCLRGKIKIVNGTIIKIGILLGRGLTVVPRAHNVDTAGDGGENKGARDKGIAGGRIGVGLGESEMVESEGVIGGGDKVDGEFFGVVVGA